MGVGDAEAAGETVEGGLAFEIPKEAEVGAGVAAGVGLDGVEEFFGAEGDGLDAPDLDHGVVAAAAEPLPFDAAAEVFAGAAGADGDDVVFGAVDADPLAFAEFVFGGAAEGEGVWEAARKDAEEFVGHAAEAAPGDDEVNGAAVGAEFGEEGVVRADGDFIAGVGDVVLFEDEGAEGGEADGAHAAAEFFLEGFGGFVVFGAGGVGEVEAVVGEEIEEAGGGDEFGGGGEGGVGVDGGRGVGGGEEIGEGVGETIPVGAALGADEAFGVGAFFADPFLDDLGEDGAELAAAGETEEPLAAGGGEGAGVRDFADGDGGDAEDAAAGAAGHGTTGEGRFELIARLAVGALEPCGHVGGGMGAGEGEVKEGAEGQDLWAGDGRMRNGKRGILQDRQGGGAG